MSTQDPDRIAARWIARRDAGLSPADQAQLARWLEIPAHAEAFARQEAMWAALPKLRRLSPSALDALYAPRKRRLAPIIWLSATAAAAAIALVLVTLQSVRSQSPAPALATFQAPADAESRVALPDGSVALLHRGSRIAFGSTGTARRVRLLSGEAHFTVAKTSPAPFFVYAGSLTVRDIGTAFNVRLDSDRVAVLVTDGSIAVQSAGAVLASPKPASANSEVVLTLGEQAVLEKTDGVARLAVVAPPAPQREETLAWKSRRLAFDRTSLRDAVVEINRYNVRQVRIAEASLESLSLAGGVQSDNLDAFIVLLESGFGVSAERRGDEILLRRAK